LNGSADKLRPIQEIFCVPLNGDGDSVRLKFIRLFESIDHIGSCACSPGPASTHLIDERPFRDLDFRFVNFLPRERTSQDFSRERGQDGVGNDVVDDATA
jgi:hypothetical protein